MQHHVELGYATTAYRAQGRSVDTSHALIDATTNREVLYVAATRGRHANTIYLNTCDRTDDEHPGMAGRPPEPDEILSKALAKTSAEPSALTVLQRHRPPDNQSPPAPVAVQANGVSGGFHQ